MRSSLSREELNQGWSTMRVGSWYVKKLVSRRTKKGHVVIFWWNQAVAIFPNSVRIGKQFGEILCNGGGIGCKEIYGTWLTFASLNTEWYVILWVSSTCIESRRTQHLSIFFISCSPSILITLAPGEYVVHSSDMPASICSWGLDLWRVFHSLPVDVLLLSLQGVLSSLFFEQRGWSTGCYWRRRCRSNHAD